MKIIADENIVCVREAFAEFGEVITLPGRAITAAAVRDADILLVRSVTQVDATLLHESAVRYVGTATIGTDHIDLEFLRRSGIAFAHAAGCNANAVAEYVITALADLFVHRGRPFAEATLGVIGVGRIGTRVARLARALGMQVLLNDPPLARATGDPGYVSLDAVLQAEVLTLHVPLTRSGPEATYHLLDAGKLDALRDDAVLINTARGPVVDNVALRRWLAAHPQAAAVLDVWEGEPEIDTGLLRQATLATPHIAGYSLEGKLDGTLMLYRALCRFLQRGESWQPHLPAVDSPQLTVRGDTGVEQAVYEATSAVCPIRRDDAELRHLLQLPAEGRATYFDALRQNYPLRREFLNYRVHLQPADLNCAAMLAAVGFNVA